MSRLLAISSQRVGATTGSGVAASQISAELARAGWDVTLVHGTDGGDSKTLGPWAEELGITLRPTLFAPAPGAVFPHPVVGMSNQMPYPSVTYASLSPRQFEALCDGLTKALGRAIAESQPDLIHVHHLWVIAAVLARLDPKVPVIASAHGTELHRVRDCPEIFDRIRGDLGRFQAYTALSAPMAAELPALYGMPASRVHTLGNGFDTRTFRPRPPADARADLRRAELPQDRPWVVFAGKFARWKGLDHLIRAFEGLRDDPRRPFLVIAGTGPDEEVASYSKLIENGRLGRDVALLGHVGADDLARLFTLAQVFVMPSFEEPFGLVLLEALASGAAVVAAAQGGPLEFVPRSLREAGLATLIPGLPRLEASPAEAGVYQRDLAAAISARLSAPLTMSDRARISDAVKHLGWTSYSRRLLDLVGMAG